MDTLVRLFKALADTSRLKIFKLLTVDEMCVCELAEILNVSQPCVSQHIQKLKIAGLIKERRKGQWIYYSVDEKALAERLAGFDGFVSASLEKLEFLAPELQRLQDLDRVETINACRWVKEGQP